MRPLQILDFLASFSVNGLFISCIAFYCFFLWRKSLIWLLVLHHSTVQCFPGGSDGKESACCMEYLGSILGLGRSPGEWNGYPLQYSCLENSMGRRPWPTVHGVANSWTGLCNEHSHFHVVFHYTICLIYLSMEPILVPQKFHNKAYKLDDLKQQKFIISQFLSFEVLKCWLPLKALRKDSSLPLVASGSSWCSLACTA